MPALKLNEHRLEQLARLVSQCFTPIHIPLIAFILLFTCTYLAMMPIGYKLIVLGIICSFTILLPLFSILLFRHFNHLSKEDMHSRKVRYTPMLLFITSYAACLLLMIKLHIPWYMTGIILSFLVTLVVGIICNLKWKLSEHMAGNGTIVGGIVAYSALFGYNPLGWLMLFIAIAGFLGSARIILGHHTLGEVIGGFLIGWISALIVLHPAYNLLFRLILL